MEIKELHIKNFGKFTDEHFVLEKGIHVFYGENEYGKSTIFAFIKAMLFGLERAKGRAAQNDEFSRCEPWDNPNYFAGTMRFMSGGKNFCLRRSFDRYTKSASLTCEDDGEELSVKDGDLEMLLGGMSKELFEDTIAIGQLTAKPGRGLAEELKNYAANFYETGSNTIDLARALESLRQNRKSADQEIKKLTEEERLKREALCQRCQYILEETEKLKKELNSNQKKLNSFQNMSSAALDLPTTPDSAPALQLHANEHSQSASHRQLDSNRPSQPHAQLRDKSSFPNNTSFIGFAVGILCILAGIGEASELSFNFLGIGLVLCTAVSIQVFLELKDKKRDKKEGEKEDEIQDKKLEAGEQTEGYRKLEWENQRIRAEWREKRIQYENLQEQLEEMEGLTEKMEHLQRKRQAALLAQEKLMEAVHGVAKGVGRKFNEHASEILSQITSGKYTKLLIDEQLTVVLFEEGQRILLDRVSRGTMEQVYFAVRMAAVDMLCQEQVPLIFDEAFAYYDEKRLKAAIGWLSRQNRQVILFTCQSREQDLVKRA